MKRGEETGTKENEQILTRRMKKRKRTGRNEGVKCMWYCNVQVCIVNRDVNVSAGRERAAAVSQRQQPSRTTERFEIRAFTWSDAF